MTTTVHLNKRLTHLDPADAQAWRDWFTHHGINDWSQIFLPSQLTWTQRSKTLQVQVQRHDDDGMPYTVAVKIKVPGRLWPFPGGYRVEED